MNKMLKWGLVLGGSILLAGGSAVGTRQWAYSSAADMVKDKTADKDKVLGRLKLAYNLGNSKAASLIGELYRTGDVLPKHQAEAVVWYRKAAEGGDPNGQNWMGVFYHEGDGVPKDPAEAIKWYRRAAEQGDPTGETNLGTNLLFGDGAAVDMKEGVKWLRLGAEHGSARAQTLMGTLCKLGGEANPLKQDDAEAVRWFRKAADQGDALGQSRLGEAYQHGQGVTQDIAQAVSWYTKSADQGSPEGQTNLGALYDDGMGVRKDVERAQELYTQAAEQGYPRAQVLLGSSLMAEGRFSEAAPWFKAAADQGNAGAKELLEICNRYAAPAEDPIVVQRLGVVPDESGRPRIRGIVQNVANRPLNAMVRMDLVQPDGTIIDQFQKTFFQIPPGGRQLIDIAIAPYHANARVKIRAIQWQ